LLPELNIFGWLNRNRWLAAMDEALSEKPLADEFCVITFICLLIANACMALAGPADWFAYLVTHLVIPCIYFLLF